MNRDVLEERLAELPLYVYYYIDPKELDFSERIRYICENECPMYGKSWACPPGVGGVSQCEEKCKSYNSALLIGTITEVSDVANINECLETRGPHEQVTNQVRDMMRALGVEPYVLSSEACAACERCAILDGKPCRYPERMHPCVESHGIVLTTTLDALGLEFQYGGNMITWYSLLLFNE